MQTTATEKQSEGDVSSETTTTTTTTSVAAEETTETLEASTLCQSEDEQEVEP